MDIREKGVFELQKYMSRGELSSAEIVDSYIERIDSLDCGYFGLNSIIQLNSSAIDIAKHLDLERKTGHIRGPLHGIPIVVKDNFSTIDMPTSAGSLALAGMQTPFDAVQVQKLRQAGAVVLAKTNMDDFASGFTTCSSLGGQTLNPYDRQLTPGGSSGGTAVAVTASLATVGWGTDTGASLRGPAARNSLFALRPTIGLLSMGGVVPLSRTHDSAAPMARSVADLSVALDAVLRPALAKGRWFSKPAQINPAVNGRLGVVDAFAGSPIDPRIVAAFNRSLDHLREAGVSLVEVSLPSDIDPLQAIAWRFEFRRDINRFLATVPDAPCKTLRAIIDRGFFLSRLNEELEASEAIDSSTDSTRAEVLSRRRRLRRRLAEFLRNSNIDGLVYPSHASPPLPAGMQESGPPPPVSLARISGVGRPSPSMMLLSSVTGFPEITLPAGLISNGLPFGLEILGLPFSDWQLVGIARAYERVAEPRRAPDIAGAHGLALQARISRAGEDLAHALFEYDPRSGYVEYHLQRLAGAPASPMAVVVSTTCLGRAITLQPLGQMNTSETRGCFRVTAGQAMQLRRGEWGVTIVTNQYPEGITASLSPVLGSTPNLARPHR